jgi:chromosome segregation ATPase
MTEPVFLIGLGMFATTVVLVARTIAGAISGRGASRSEFAQLRELLEQQAAALEDTETRLASQSTQLSELHERLDFAERLLTKARDRTALGPGDKPG